MRARPGLLVGWGAVGAYALLVGAVAWVAVTHDDLDRSGEPVEPVAAFIAAWERSRTATFVTVGTFERRSEVTGAVITSEDVVAQRPPARLHRQLGGIDGRVDDQLLVCPAAPPDDDAPPCQLGPSGGPTYAESVATELAGLESVLEGPAPLYTVTRAPDGCFSLSQQRVEPRAPFGIEARFCFDGAVGAPVARSVTYEGGISEILVVDEVRAEVREADLRP